MQRAPCRIRGCGVWYTRNHEVPIAWRRRSERRDVPDTQLKIAPIGEGLSLKARAYEALKAAITNMNI